MDELKIVQAVFDAFREQISNKQNIFGDAVFTKSEIEDMFKAVRTKLVEVYKELYPEVYEEKKEEQKKTEDKKPKSDLFFKPASEYSSG